jgi:hypothetical protein
LTQRSIDEAERLRMAGFALLHRDGLSSIHLRAFLLVARRSPFL